MLIRKKYIIVIGDNMIFIISLSRMGTTSLKNALGMLGYKINHHPRPPLLPQMAKQLKGFDGASDSPIAYQYKELDKLFPNSKFIFTTRPLDDWLKSCKWFLKNGIALKRDDEFRELMYGDKNFNRQKYTEVYERHHKEVFEYFKDRELLVLNLNKNFGWKPICKFLNKNIPKKKFPHKNKTR